MRIKPEHVLEERTRARVIRGRCTWVVIPTAVGVRRRDDLNAW
jgi:hypothetical protein